MMHDDPFVLVFALNDFASYPVTVEGNARRLFFSFCGMLHV